MAKLYEGLKNLYSVQKTLRFELKPQGNTLNKMIENGVIDRDENRAIKYKKVKKYCDEYHKFFIKDVLKDLKLEGLDEYYKLYGIKEETENLDKIKEELRKQISSAFKKDKRYKGLLSADMIKKYLVEYYVDNKEILNDINEFNQFTTYFNGYNTNRENMYVFEEKSTAISYRLINENLPTFISNMNTFNKVKELLPDILNKVSKELEEYIQVMNISEIFALDYYNEVLTQEGIECYNIIISGKSLKDNIKIKGLNEYINEYNQKNEKKIPKMKELYKQILSDREGASFVIEAIDTDKELIDDIDKYYDEFNKIIDATISLVQSIDNYDLDKIYINNDLTLTSISKDVFDDWSFIQTKIIENYDLNYNGKYVGKNYDVDKYIAERDKALKKVKQYSIKALDEMTNDENKIATYFKNYISDNCLLEIIKENYEKYNSVKLEYYNDNKELIKKEKEIEIVKSLLDSFKSTQNFIKKLIVKDNTIEKDEVFYNELINKYDFLKEIIPLYNKARNYLTQKPYADEKIKINFDCSTLLDGWDVNKERDNLGILFIKDDNYYVGILNKGHNDIFKGIKESSGESGYKKINYKFFKDLTTMVPKCTVALNEVKKHFSSETNDYLLNNDNFIKPLIITKEIFDLANSEEGKIKKYQLEYLRKTGDEKGYKDALYKWMNFCIEFLNSYKSTVIYGINDIEISKYEDLPSFYNDINKRLYNISFTNIPEEVINEYVEKGYLYLFKLYNKDFSEYSKGTPNLHTLYWKALFDNRNLKNVVYKLDGGAEIFYRKASLKLEDTAIHKANMPVENKNRNTIEKGKKTSLFKYDLIKNKRYTEDKFQFHVPITMNFQNMGLSNIKELVNKNIKNTEDIYIIGIDRGERHLLYVSVIDSKGNIVEQKSLNDIVNIYNEIKYETNYHELLDKKEKEREAARESWKTVENIKELKEGYMSQVLHVITEYMKKYNAIIVIEDLNYGFKNSRIKVEKQVYQKFENMLINKLNYLVFKENKIEEDGGILNAYQLTNKFESFEKLGKQTGVLFYIPAWNTSKIDPLTGFVNLFSIKNTMPITEIKTFISNIDKISYNEGQNYFEFYIDYDKFGAKYKDTQRKWTLCSYGKRIKTFRNPEKNNSFDNIEVDLTEEFKNLLKTYSIPLDENIKDNILLNDKFDFKSFMYLFKLLIQMRNSRINEEEDYLVSPVRGKNGEFFDTRANRANLPTNADANGAYNIARKGLMLVKQIKETEDEKLGKFTCDISNEKWLNFAQNEGNV